MNVRECWQCYRVEDISLLDGNLTFRVAIIECIVVVIIGIGEGRSGR